MKLVVERKWRRAAYTVGRLFVDGKMVGNTLELPDGLRGAAPAGTYKVVMAPSRKFHKMMPFLVDVPGRIGIMIHYGNSVKDTKGCILVGQNTEVGRLLQSRKTLDPVIKQMTEAGGKGEEIVITIS